MLGIMIAPSTTSLYPQFRRFDPGTDLEAVLGVYERAIGGLDPHLYSRAQRQAWLRWCSDPRKVLFCLHRGLTLLALVDNEVAGFAQLHPRHLINMLYVDPHFSRQGVATQLVFKLEDAARKEGTELLETRASHASRNVFSRCGYQARGRDIIYSGGIAIARNVMSKPLTSTPEVLSETS